MEQLHRLLPAWSYTGVKPHIQEQLRQEAHTIHDQLGTDELDYDSLSECRF